jgi:hypothetical protein
MGDGVANGLPAHPEHLRQIGFNGEQQADRKGATANPLLDHALHLEIKGDGGKLVATGLRQIRGPERRGAGCCAPEMSRGHSAPILDGPLQGHRSSSGLPSHRDRLALWAIARNFGFLRANPAHAARDGDDPRPDGRAPSGDPPRRRDVASFSRRSRPRSDSCTRVAGTLALQLYMFVLGTPIAKLRAADAARA